MNNKQLRANAKEALQQKWWLAVGVTFVASMIIGAASNFAFVGVLFLGYPIYYGTAKFFMAVRNRYGTFEDLFSGFKENYIDNILTFLIRELLVLLWTLLLIIPGIIKGIEYAMTPYILVDYDINVTHMDALRMSQDMMTGYKMKYFRMQLYFFLWHVLGLLTFGILNIIYVIPYQHMSNTEFYYDLKDTLGIKKSKKEYMDQPVHKIDEITDDEWDF